MGSGSAGDGLSNDQVMQLLLANDASPNTLGRMYLSLHRRGGAAAAGDTEGGTPLPAEPAPPAAAPPPRRTVAPGVGVMPQQQGPVRATRPVTSSRGDASARPGRPPRTAQGARSMPADTRAARALFEFSGGDACARARARAAAKARARPKTLRARARPRPLTISIAATIATSRASGNPARGGRG